MLLATLIPILASIPFVPVSKPEISFSCVTTPAMARPTITFDSGTVGVGTLVTRRNIRAMPRVHRVRAGELEQYVPPQRGLPCSWMPLGRVLAVNRDQYGIYYTVEENY